LWLRVVRLGFGCLPCVENTQFTDFTMSRMSAIAALKVWLSKIVQRAEKAKNANRGKCFGDNLGV